MQLAMAREPDFRNQGSARQSETGRDSSGVAHEGARSHPLEAEALGWTRARHLGSARVTGA
jgi:hypothetical protein